MIIRKDNFITIVIDNQEVEDYHEHYFHKYPGRRKKPIKEPIWESVNVWGNKTFQARNTMKQQWRSFMEYIIHKHGYNDLMLDKVSLTCVFYYKTKHKKDMDNYSPKFCLDGLVSSGFLVDDNCEHLNPLTLKFGGYDKENTRVEMIFEILD